MELKITITKPLFSKVAHGRDCVLVEFPNCVDKRTGKPYYWMPRYNELQDIKKALDQVERASWGINPHPVDVSGQIKLGGD